MKKEEAKRMYSWKNLGGGHYVVVAYENRKLVDVICYCDSAKACREKINEIR